MPFNVFDQYYSRQSRYLRRGKTAPTAAAIDMTITPAFPGISSPGAPTLTPSITGGVLPAATYGYRISATNVNGETLAGTEATAVVASGTTGSVGLTWGAVTGATGYNVYGRTASGELLLAVLGNVLAWTDTGSIAPSGALPTVNSTQVIAGIVAGQINAGDSVYRTALGVASLNNAGSANANTATYCGEAEDNYPKLLGLGSGIEVGFPTGAPIAPYVALRTSGEFRKKTTPGDTYTPGDTVYLGADAQTVQKTASGTALGKVCNDQNPVSGGFSGVIIGAAGQDVVIEINPPAAV